MGYKYFDTPDGQDCDKKTLFLLKKAGVLGIYLGAGYVLIYPAPTYTQIFGRIARITLPLCTAAVIGSLSVCMLTKQRAKDDINNHLYGGFIGGLAGGLAKGHLGHGIVAGLAIGALAASYKDVKIYNYVINKGDFKFNTDDHWTKDYDLTLSKKIAPDWIAK